MLERRSRKLALRLQIAVRIHLDHVDLSRLRHAEIDSRIIAKPQRLVCVDRNLLHSSSELVGKVRGKNRFGAGELGALSLAVVTPLGRPAGDLGQVGRELREIQLDDGQRLNTAVAEDADVELPAVYELLGENRRLVFSLKRADRLEQLLHVVDNGFLRYPEGRIFLRRLDDQRKVDVTGPVDVPAK